MIQPKPVGYIFRYRSSQTSSLDHHVLDLVCSMWVPYPAHESTFSSISSPSTLTTPAPVFHCPIAKRWLTPSSLGTQTAPPHPPVRCIGTRKKTSLTRECNSAIVHIT